MGVFSRNKGNREERAIVNLHKQHGFEAKRVPLSGAAEGFKGDIILHGLVGEAKLRAPARGLAPPTKGEKAARPRKRTPKVSCCI